MSNVEHRISNNEVSLKKSIESNDLFVAETTSSRFS